MPSLWHGPRATSVVKECTSSAMLHVEVALANTPDDLRENFVVG